jgi:hypothetical protein
MRDNPMLGQFDGPGRIAWEILAKRNVGARLVGANKKQWLIKFHGGAVFNTNGFNGAANF